MPSSVTVYSETYVEHEDGWRVRIHDEDGAVVIEYEEFKQSTSEYVNTGRFAIGPAEFAEELGVQLTKFAKQLKENA